MELLFTIHSPVAFFQFYTLVLVLAIGMLFYAGFKAKYPMSTWSTVVAFLFFTFLVGLNFFPNIGKSMAFGHADLPAMAHARSAFGGVLLILAATVFVKWFLKIRVSIFDSIVLFIPVLGITQRINCLFSGCCYGTQTNMPWALHYTSHFQLWEHQVQAGIIAPTDTLTAGVHPVQLYIILLLTVIFFLILGFRKYWKQQGSLSLFALLLMAFQRFVVEFFREPLPDKWFSHSLAGMNMLQWIILALVPVFVVILYKNETKRIQVNETARSENPERNFILIILMAFFAWNMNSGFSLCEIWMVQILVTLAFALNMAAFLLQYTNRAFLKYSIGFVAAFVLLTSQQVAVKDSVSDTGKYPNAGWFSVNGSLGGGYYEEIEHDCNGNTIKHPRSYNVQSLGFAYHLNPSPYTYLTLGTNFSRAYDRSEESPSNFNYGSYYSRIGMLNPYVAYDMHYFGIGLGGQFNSEFVAPSGFIRAGPSDRFFFRMDVLEKYYSSFHGLNYRLGVGTGLHSKTDQLLFGITTPNFNGPMSVYVSGKFLVNYRVTIEPSVILGNQFHASVEMHYHFGKNRWAAIRDN